jgi:RHS repeat-associated protein
VTTNFAYDGVNLVAELDSEGNVLRSYQWGLGKAGSIGALLSITDESGTYTTVYDSNGNITELLDADGNVAASYAYSAFGKLLSATGPAADICPFGWQTMYRDPVTGLISFPMRDYSPELARWTTPDPSGEGSGLNLYALTGNDPINKNDPMGLEWRYQVVSRLLHYENGPEWGSGIAWKWVWVEPAISDISDAQQYLGDNKWHVTSFEVIKQKADFSYQFEGIILTLQSEVNVQCNLAGGTVIKSGTRVYKLQIDLNAENYFTVWQPQAGIAINLPSSIPAVGVPMLRKLVIDNIIKSAKAFGGSHYLIGMVESIGQGVIDNFGLPDDLNESSGHSEALSILFARISDVLKKPIPASAGEWLKSPCPPGSTEGKISFKK